MKEIKEKEFKNIALDMLIELTNYLEKHNLRYMLDYGTLLGAIRHKGFIPWDDDIDITMPREDYDKLYELLKKDKFSLTENYKLAAFTNRYNIYKIYYNIVDIRTITESKARKEKYWYPIWIDIFPADYISVDEKENLDTVKEISRILGFCWYSLSYDINKNIKTKVGKFLKKILIKPSYSKIHRMIKFKDVNSNKLNVYYLGKYKEIDIDYFNNYIYKEFEGYKFRVPKKYKKRLEDCYGEYMKIPPKKDRVSHFSKAYYK